MVAASKELSVALEIEAMSHTNGFAELNKLINDEINKNIELLISNKENAGEADLIRGKIHGLRFLLETVNYSINKLRQEN